MTAIPSTLTLRQTLSLAVRQHQAGKLSEAQSLYEEILRHHSEHPDALHLMGCLYAQTNRRLEGVELIRRAIAIKPDDTEYYRNLGAVYVSIGGYAEAIKVFLSALEQWPSNVDMLCYLSDAQRREHLLYDAAASAQKAIDLRPGHAPAWNALAMAQRDKKSHAEAQISARRATELWPEYGDAYVTLGTIQMSLDNYADAVRTLYKAVELLPNNPQAHNCLGAAMQGDRDTQAVESYKKAIELDPKCVTAFSNLGAIYASMGRAPEGIPALRRALELSPQSPEILTNLAKALRGDYQFNEAIQLYSRVAQMLPNDAALLESISGLMLEVAQFDEALAYMERALAIAPDNASAHSGYLYSLHYDSRRSPSEVFEAHIEFDRKFCRTFGKEIPPHFNDPNPNRRIRIGYVSHDMRTHSVAFFLLPLIQNHNNADFEITCYYTGASEDPVTALFKARADRWVSLDRLSDAEAAQKIREDRIDILVDCSGHTGGHRMLMFARKPAPVQVTFLGYPNTTGLSAIDYRLTDYRADPNAFNDALASEYLHRLPNSAWCFNPLADPFDVTDSPFLEKGFITFGTFNAFVKLNEPMMRNWVRIVQSTRNSRLLLKNSVMKDPVFLHRVVQTLLAMGLKREQFDLIPHQKSREDHFRSFGMLDIALDTFPYNGTTGTCETLFNGVPVITLAGKTHVSRVGTSLLHSVGLGNLVAENDEDYVCIAVELANDPFRLTDIRGNLRKRMMQSPLMDGAAYARDVESAYRTMWRHWCGQRNGG